MLKFSLPTQSFIVIICQIDCVCAPYESVLTHTQVDYSQLIAFPPLLSCMIYHEFNSAQLSISTHQTAVAMVRLKWIWMTIELLSRLELLWVTNGRLHANNKRKLCAEKIVQGRERVKNCIIMKWLTHKVAQSERVGEMRTRLSLSTPPQCHFPCKLIHSPLSLHVHPRS